MTDFWEFMRMSVSVAMPQAFAFMLFVMSFLHPTPRNLAKRIVLFAVVHSLYTDSMQHFLPLPFHLINSVFAQIVLYLLLFRDLSMRVKVAVFFFTNAFIMLVEIVWINTVLRWFGVLTREQMLHDKWWIAALVNLVTIIPILAAARYIRNHNNFSPKRYFLLLMDENRGALNKVIVLILIQFLLLGATQFLEFADENNKVFTSTVITYLVVAVSFAILVFILRLLIGTRNNAVRMTQGVYVGDINRMFASIKGQRHDFINHLQTIHSMAQSGQTGELQLYVKELVRETREVNEIVNHRFPALAAFVQAKTAVAVARGIAFTFQLPEGPDCRETSVRIIDMVRILGNLVDNAFDEVMSFPADQREVHVTVRYEEDKVVLEVTNRGRVLTQAEKDIMFTPGYSTKSEGEHSGLGLAIVLERTRHYGGTVELTSDETNGTSFIIILPQEPSSAG